MLPSKRPLLAQSIMGVLCNLQHGAVEYGPPGNHFHNIVCISRKGSPDEAPKRPNNLAVSASCPQLRTKREVLDREQGDDSLPCTPELQSDDGLEMACCPVEDDSLDGTTRELLELFLRDTIAHKGPSWTDSKQLSAVKKVVAGLLEKHTYAYRGMIKNLNNRLDNEGTITAVSKSLFGDGTTNWGRIASLLAFGAVVCLYLTEQGRDDSVELVGQEISSYLLTNQRDWLRKNNSWDGFVEFFRESDPEASVRNTLLSIAGVAGIGATLALLIR